MMKRTQLFALAFSALLASPLLAQAAPSPAVPTLGEVGLAVFAASLVTGGAVMIRRRKR